MGFLNRTSQGFLRKKALLCMFSLVVIFSIFSISPTAHAETDTSTGLTYTVSNGKATITRFNNSSETLSIPSTLGGYPVVSIGDYAFYNCQSLKNVTIPSGVTSIGNSAFRNCYALTNVTIPSGVTSIEDYTFNFCYSLTNITIPSEVTNIGNYAFASCSGLISVTMPSGVTSIGNYAFSYCSSIRDLTISSSVTSIGNSAFYDCQRLKNVTLPNGLTSIGSYAFNDCSSITNITIPSSVTSIGNSAFGSCYNLFSINVESNNSLYTSIDGVLFNKSATVLLQYPNGKAGATYSIPNGVTTIARESFSNCVLNYVIIPSSVTSLEEYAFYYCKSLKKITISNGIRSIGNYAFRDCSSFFSMYGGRGTYAEAYAKQNGINFIDIATNSQNSW